MEDWEKKSGSGDSLKKNDSDKVGVVMDHAGTVFLLFSICWMFAYPAFVGEDDPERLFLDWKFWGPLLGIGFLGIYLRVKGTALRGDPLFPEAPKTKKSDFATKVAGAGCWCLLVSVFIIMGSLIVIFDDTNYGMGYSIYLKIGLGLFIVGFLGIFFSRLIRKFTSNN